MTLHKLVNGTRIEMSPEEEAAIKAEWAANEAKQKARAWLDGRIKDYPSISDQLDMLWHELDVYGTIEKAGPWYKAIEAVKNKYPKPE